MACRSEYPASVIGLAVSLGLPERTAALEVSPDKQSGNSRFCRPSGLINRWLIGMLRSQEPTHQCSPATYLQTVHDTTTMMRVTIIMINLRATMSRGVFNVPKCAQPKSHKVSHTSWLQLCLLIMRSVAYQSAHQNPAEVTASPWPLPPSRLTVPATAPGLAVALPDQTANAT